MTIRPQFAASSKKRGRTHIGDNNFFVITSTPPPKGWASQRSLDGALSAGTYSTLLRATDAELKMMQD
jgi:hypothetical protein